MLYYYRKPWNGPHGYNQPSAQRNITNENGSGILSRWLSSHYHGGVHDEKAVARHTVNLLTSTIKFDADQTDLRFCFRIISPSKNYTLQAENAIDQMDWMEKINGVIASLLSVQTLGMPLPYDCKNDDGDSANKKDTSESSTNSALTEKSTPNNSTPKSQLRASISLQLQRHSMRMEKPIDVLRRVSGNNKCADCGKPEPDWASLNLGILVCIECSGGHRNLGVHISKVRSLALDVKVWEPSVLAMFKSLGNVFANSVWEELLGSTSTLQTDDASAGSLKANREKLSHAKKPEPDDSISLKEKFIHAKYSEKIFTCREKKNQPLLLLAQQVWESICANDNKAVYQHIVQSEVDINAISGQALSGGSFNMASSNSDVLSQCENQLIENIKHGSSVLHLACLTADIGMVELLLQYGADMNACDSRGQTPLHYCITAGKTDSAKVLIMRGASPHVADKEGKTPLKLASESSSVDREILSLLENR